MLVIGKIAEVKNPARVSLLLKFHVLIDVVAVSYTHLTLPTIYSV